MVYTLSLSMLFSLSAAYRIQSTEPTELPPPCSQLELMGTLAASSLGSPFTMAPYVCGQEFLTNQAPAIQEAVGDAPPPFPIRRVELLSSSHLVPCSCHSITSSTKSYLLRDDMNFETRCEDDMNFGSRNAGMTWILEQDKRGCNAFLDKLCGDDMNVWTKSGGMIWTVERHDGITSCNGTSKRIASFVATLPMMAARVSLFQSMRRESQFLLHSIYRAKQEKRCSIDNS
jgi:hypothetical protein